jgi:hypothetical protein
MKPLIALFVGLALFAACQASPAPAPTEPAAPKASKPVNPPSPFSVYTEAEHEGRLYVLGTRAAAEALREGRTPVLAITKVGGGPGGKTLVFEANKEGNLEKWLQSEYALRHPAE